MKQERETLKKLDRRQSIRTLDDCAIYSRKQTQTTTEETLLHITDSTFEVNPSGAERFAQAFESVLEKVVERVVDRVLGQIADRWNLEKLLEAKLEQPLTQSEQPQIEQEEKIEVIEDTRQSKIPLRADGKINWKAPGYTEEQIVYLIIDDLVAQGLDITKPSNVQQAHGAMYQRALKIFKSSWQEVVEGYIANR